MPKKINVCLNVLWELLGLTTLEIQYANQSVLKVLLTRQQEYV